MRGALRLLFIATAASLIAAVIWASRPVVPLDVAAASPTPLPSTELPGTDAAIAYAGRRDTAIDALVVLRGGEVGASWGDVAIPMDTASVRKGLSSLLFGIAIDKGLVSLETTIAELGIDDAGAPLTDLEKCATIEDLLTSRSGIYISAGAETQWMKDNRPARGMAAPGEEFFYNNWSFNVLGVIFEQVSGLQIGEALNLWIARPVGMEDFSPEHVIYQELDGVSAFPTYRIYISARDLARVGTLILNDGSWDGQQIVPPAWIARLRVPVSVLPPTEDGGEPDAFTYSWWVEGETGNLYHEGWGGQYLYVDAANDLVIVTRRNTGMSLLGAGLFLLWGTQGELYEMHAIRDALTGAP